LEIVSDELLYSYYYGCIEHPEFKCMLLQFMADYRGMVKALHVGQAPAHVGACTKCCIKGQPGPGCQPECMGGRKRGKSTAAGDSMEVEGTTHVEAPSEVQPRGTSRAVEVPSAGQPKPKKKAQQTSFKSTIYPGAFTEVHQASYLRHVSCKLNPTFNNNQPTFLHWSASAPRRKTDAELRQAAIDADNALAQGHGIDHITHPYQDTGVIGSYAFQMLPYWDSQIMCNPDPAHCLANESKAIFSLVAKCAPYTPLRLSVISKYEHEVNKRWDDVSTPRDLPWLLTAENLKKATRRAECFNLKQCGYVPAPLSSIRVHLLLSTPSYLKMHEHIMCLGPVAKYILQGLMPEPQETALFHYFDCLGNLWRRNQVTQEVGTLIQETKDALALMEAAFPAWELDINRHSIIHVAEATSVCGPSPTFTTFVFERMWGRMGNWLSQRAYPEASMMQQYMVYKMTSQHQRRELVCDPTDRAVDSALLPGFLDDSGECRVADGEECTLTESDNMELHLLLLTENVIPGPEGEAYRQMWQDYTTGIRWVHCLHRLAIMHSCNQCKTDKGNLYSLCTGPIHSTSAYIEWATTFWQNGMIGLYRAACTLWNYMSWLWVPRPCTFKGGTVQQSREYLSPLLLRKHVVPRTALSWSQMTPWLPRWHLAGLNISTLCTGIAGIQT